MTDVVPPAATTTTTTATTKPNSSSSSTTNSNGSTTDKEQHEIIMNDNTRTKNNDDDDASSDSNNNALTTATKNTATGTSKIHFTLQMGNSKKRKNHSIHENSNNISNTNHHSDDDNNNDDDKNKKKKNVLHFMNDNDDENNESKKRNESLLLFANELENQQKLQGSNNKEKGEEAKNNHSHKKEKEGDTVAIEHEEMIRNENDNSTNDENDVVIMEKVGKDLQNVNNNDDNNDNDDDRNQLKKNHEHSLQQQPQQHSQEHSQHQQSSHLQSRQQAIPSTQQPLIQQPSGWRVKLYRLNLDGSWDDCGTGRICLISKNTSNNSNSKKELQQQQQHVQIQSTRDQQHHKLEEEIYHTLGEPTLFMHAELPNGNVSPTSNNNKPKSKILLRTRVLLRDSYQRQGENIITWCEPHFATMGHVYNNRENDNQHQHQQLDHLNNGVDLALSFQDNAGCLEIWNKISNIQLKAFEMYQARNHNNSQLSSTAHQRLSTSASSSSLAEVGMEETSGGTRKHHDGNLSSATASIDIDDEHILMLHKNNGRSPPPDNSQTNLQHTSNWTTATNLKKNEEGVIDTMEYSIDKNDHHQHKFIEAQAAAVSMAAEYVGNGNLNHNHSDIHYESHEQSKHFLHQLSDLESSDGNFALNAQLPNPPQLGNLEKIADIIAAAQPAQREAISLFVSLSNCAYLKSLLALFPAAEEKDDYNNLATLASIIKTIFLFNEPGIIQLIASDGKIFEECCCCLEFDPDLRSKANHRWFIRDRLKFRTVVYMKDQDLVETIHKAFRVTFIRDTLLRPTMDESSLTTLGSLLTFTHADVVKGVMCAPDSSSNNSDSYLVQVLRLLGKEIQAIRELEWSSICQTGHLDSISMGMRSDSSAIDGPSLSLSSSNDSSDLPWKQHLVPQDDSLSSRKIRRRGCLSFLRELFNMVRMSLQQADKDDFYNFLATMDVELHDSSINYSEENAVSPTKQSVKLLSLLGAILSDINADISEKGACLEILSVIAMFDASLIRKHCLIEFSMIEKDGENGKFGDKGVTTSSFARPLPDQEDNIIFLCPPNNLLLSLLFVMVVENDAGIMLQTSEILRIILDTEMFNEACHLNGVAMIDNNDELPLGLGNGSFQFGAHISHCGTEGGSEQNSFLQMFYDHYLPWFVAPFQYKTLVCRAAIPYSLCKKSNDKVSSLQERVQHEPKPSFQHISPSALRLSFSIELLSFCVRAHCFRMKRYLLSHKVLASVMKLLTPNHNEQVDGDRCLKLAVLRCLRSVLSLKDEFYNRHIVQNNLFTPVFDAFRANPVGDNLVSSSIIEMCDFIRTENIKSVIEHIATKYLGQKQYSSSSISDSPIKRIPSLEDVATPYVDTLTLLRQKYEENKTLSNLKVGSNDTSTDNENQNRLMQNEKAREDQRKFQESSSEESYFFDDANARPPSPAPSRTNNGINI